jgi:hypothetical protein
MAPQDLGPTNCVTNPVLAGVAILSIAAGSAGALFFAEYAREMLGALHCSTHHFLFFIPQQ